MLVTGDALSAKVLAVASGTRLQAATVEVTDAVGNTVTGTLIIATPANIVPDSDTFATLTDATGTQATVTLSLSNTGGMPGAPAVTATSILTPKGSTTSAPADLGWTLLDTGDIAPGATKVLVRIQTSDLPAADVGTAAVTFDVGTA